MMQKKEQEVYFALQGKPSKHSIFVTKNIKKFFWPARFLSTRLGEGKPTYFKVFSTAMLMLFLKLVFWKKSVFYVIC